jgi:chromate reductase, NAD(P)H dehydrogenase (quinone)
VRIIGICGSLQSKSSNLSLLESIGELSPAGVAFEIYDGIRDLPLFNPDLEADGSSPEPVVRWRATLAGADALIIASPEYGHSVPGALKNAIDWVIGSGELDNKVAGVTASVNHESRGLRGLDALLRTLAAVNVRVVGGVPIVRGSGERDELRRLITATADIVST